MTRLPSGPWLTTLAPETAKTKLRLICAPYAGGSSASFRSWRRGLPDSIALYVVELPGRGSRFGEPLVRSMRDLVPPVGEAMRPIAKNPVVLFGHSLGAAIVFELFREMQRLELPLPVRLIVSGQRAFHRPSPHPPIHDLADDGFLEEIQRFGGTPHGLFDDEELRNVFLPVLRADFTLGETYHYRHNEPLTCDLLAYGGLEDEEVTPADLKAWATYTRGPFRYRMFPGNHFFLHQHESLFLETLASDLALE